MADLLLIEQLGAARVTLATRSVPVLNDVTFEDARSMGLDGVVRLIANGSDAPGTILEDCSLEFREHFARADLVIAKGQGNLETLSDVEKNTYFLLKLKCPVVAAHVGMPLNVHAVIPSRYSDWMMTNLPSRSSVKGTSYLEKGSDAGC